MTRSNARRRRRLGVSWYFSSVCACHPRRLSITRVHTHTHTHRIVRTGDTRVTRLFRSAHAHPNLVSTHNAHTQRDTLSPKQTPAHQHQPLERDVRSTRVLACVFASHCIGFYKSIVRNHAHCGGERVILYRQRMAPGLRRKCTQIQPPSAVGCTGILSFSSICSKQYLTVCVCV